MRPERLFSLFKDVTAIKGVGSRIRLHLERLTGARIVDLLWHLPSALIDRRFRPKVADAVPGQIATLEVTVEKHIKGRGRRVPYRVITSDGTGRLTLVFFRAEEDYLLGKLPPGEQRIVSGRVERYGGNLQMTHPDHMVAPEEADQLPVIEPVYPLTQGLTLKVLRKAIRGALEMLPDLPEWLDGPYLKQQNWPGWQEAVRLAHEPLAPADLDPHNPARARLAYDELLANQLALALVRERARKLKGRINKARGVAREKILAALPYELTGSQRQVIAEIEKDMASPHAMLRLVQGDVGAGKTIVALLAMSNAIEAGRQAALLAPTEILSRQHYHSLKPLAEAAGFTIEILTGRNKGKARKAVLERLRSGETDILVGTHALFQDDVAYKDLAIAVIDEQHRFGVFQRLALSAKSTVMPDMLVMTATPIPRTLTLTIYGDMEVSRITEKPPGRQPVTTRIISQERLSEVIAGLERALRQGDQAYWICPLVEESQEMDLAAAVERYENLKAIFGEHVGLVHGRLKAAEKDAVMRRFELGEVRLLVATTVVEVGVDVASATIMVIEHAERFGLAQLHQLRGRVGRGNKASTCLLIRAKSIGSTARARLRIMRDSDDGFKIAEEDLKLRGSGELLGTRQSGMPVFRLARIEEHADLLVAASDDARLIIARDARLLSERGQALRLLLYLFERDAAVRFLKSG